MSEQKGVSLWLTSHLEKEFGTYAGVDEVGLGCFAGPVFAAAVIIDNYLWAEVDQLRDSKVVGPRKRVFLARRIKEECKWAIGRAEVAEIDEFGLRVAHARAIERAVNGLQSQVDVPAVAIDGDAFDIELGDLPVRFIRHGDDLIPAISAASIIAKVARDAHMTELAKEFPMYGWETNAAYGTAEHKAAMREHGLSPYHRRSFKPVGRIAYERGDCCDGTKPACCYMNAPKAVTEKAMRGGRNYR
jgi:ribonuclease HII